MKALECGTARPNDRQHRPSLIARHDETRAVDVCGRKHFFRTYGMDGKIR